MTALPAHDVDTRPAADALRDTFGLLPAGVTVLTTLAPDGPWGMTASSVTPLSFNPPLILACLHRASRTLSLLGTGGGFAVNVLRWSDRRTADEYSRRARTAAADPMAGFRYVDGVPVLASALVWITCDLADTHPGGDHAIVIGAIRRTGHAHGEPLIRHRSRYRRLA
jgi:3-hydroxy-9,10-secoandrosta-1,3,5(10)-triene-9,17-dione monooxygenase reductase component